MSFSPIFRIAWYSRNSMALQRKRKPSELRILAAHKFHNKHVVARAGEAHDVRATDPNRESRLDREFRIVRRALATAVTASCKSLATGPSEIFCEVFSMGLFSVKPVSRILEE